MVPEDNPVPEDIVAMGDMPPVTVVDEGDEFPEPPPAPLPEPPPPSPPVPSPEPEPPPLPPPLVPPLLQPGDEVVVRNTLDLGIRIRNTPGGDRIGGMFDGETGVVVSGPRESRGLIWVEIEWDAPVKNPKSGCGIGKNVCIGWSAVFVEDGTRVIHERE